MTQGTRRARRAVVAVLVAGLMLSGHDAGPHPDLAVEVLSSRPADVTGGDALVAVTVPEDADLSDVRVRVGDRSVTDALTPDPSGHRLVGLVEGLPNGEAHVVAGLDGDHVGVTVTNHPTSGPLFAGDHLPLHACSTHLYGLEPSTPEDDCDAPRVVRWDYVAENGSLHDLVDPTRIPEDVATTEVNGEHVRFIVRTETGVLNRSVYEIATLDPEPDPDGAPDMRAWNRRLVYQFGGGCGATFTQGVIDVEARPLGLLANGYATATATFNTTHNLCNTALSAETASIVKERFAEAYGEPTYTIGSGVSGGAIQQLLLAQNYPGLLDGLVPAMPYPDLLSIAPAALDCVRLEDYYATADGSRLDDRQRAAINGHATADACKAWDELFRPLIDPSDCTSGDLADPRASGGEGPLAVPPAQVYDAETNPDGQRCTLWESNAAMTGRDADTGFARSIYDNRGMQYGLDALNAEVISFEEFIDLNARIGGFDVDGQPTPDRSTADGNAVARVYETGGVMGPWGGIPDTPMILVTLYVDTFGDIHDRVRTHSIRDRLAGPEGGWPATVSLWTEGLERIDPSSPEADDPTAGPVAAIDQWLTAATAEQQQNGGTWPDALAESKPTVAESRCLLADGRDIIGPDANEHPACTRQFPVHDDPRMAAGGRRTGHELKCHLIGVEAAIDLYEVELTATEVERIAGIFPDGVCDHDAGGVGYRPPETTWPDLGGDQAPPAPSE